MNYCFWTNDLELLVLQNYNLLYMRHMPLRIKTDELERVNTEHRNKNMDLKVSLSRYI